MAVYQSSGLFPAEFATRSSREAACKASSRLAWMHHGTLKQNYIYMCHSVHGCAWKKKVYHGVPVFPQWLAIVIGKMMMGVPYFQTNPHDLPDLLVLQLPLPICRAPPVSQLCELWLCQPSSCGHMMDTPRETCNIPILWLFRYGKWWSTIGCRYRENHGKPIFAQTHMWHKL